MSELNSKPKIAVIGMAGRFPGAESVDELLKHLIHGNSLIRRFNEEELRESGVPNDILEDINYKPFCGYLEGSEYFDNELFAISNRDAKLLNPQHRVFLECCWSALVNAGYPPVSPPGLVGVYAGSSDSEYLSHLLNDNQIKSQCSDFELEINNSKDQLAPRVSYYLNLRGPSISIQTACSTSLVAIHMAAQSIIAGECSMALAGGISIPFCDKRGYLYKEGMNLSKDGQLRSFDENASGMVAGFGCGVVVLKALEDAIRDKDCIEAVILSSSISNDGSNKSGYTAPGVQGQIDAITTTINKAFLKVDDIQFVEAHGSGTLLGDPLEISALKKAFYTYSTKREYCAISSIKANIGHLDVAAGVAGFIKAVLQLKSGLIFPACNFTRPNPLINWKDSPFYVPTNLIEINNPLRLGCVNSLGIGGTNCFMLLQNAPNVNTRELEVNNFSNYVFKRNFFKVQTKKTEKAPALVTTIPYSESLGNILKNIWSEVLEIKEFDPRKSFFDLGGHSISSIFFIDKINHHLGLNLQTSWVHQFATFDKQLSELNQIKQQSFLPIIKFNSSPNLNKRTLIFFHASVSGAEVYHDLAKLLDDKVEFLAVDSINMQKQDGFIAKLDSLVEKYVEYILHENLSSTLYLGGWSLGGILALEVSKKLQSKGYQIPHVFMLDTIYYSEASQLFFEKNNHVYFRPDFNDDLAYQSLSLNRKEKLINLVEIETQMVKDYVGSGYSGKVTNFIAQNPLQNINGEEEIIAFRELKKLNGWSKNLFNFEIQYLQANHQNILTGECIAQVANLISEIILQ